MFVSLMFFGNPIYKAVNSGHGAVLEVNTLLLNIWELSFHVNFLRGEHFAEDGVGHNHYLLVGFPRADQFFVHGD
jgi:hypothetical protein